MSTPGSVTHVRRTVIGIHRALVTSLVAASTIGCADGTAPADMRIHVEPLDAATSVGGEDGWTLTPIPRLPDPANAFVGNGTSEAFDINDKGTIVGNSSRTYYSATDPGYPCTGISAFALRSGELVDLFANVPGTCESSSTATAVNSHDEVVGYMLDAGGEKVGWRWSADRGIQYLGGTGYDTYPLSINDSGVIVGTTIGIFDIHALKWTKDGLTNLHPAGYTTSHALKINNDGVILGLVDGFVTLWYPDGSMHISSVYGHLAPTSVYGGMSPAMGLDKLGRAVFGSGTTVGKTVGMMWSSSTAPRRLDGNPRFVNDLAVSGRVAGWSVFGTDFRTLRVVPYTAKDGVSTALPIPRGLLRARAIAINSCGTIVGSVELSITRTRAVRWSRPGCD